MSGRPALLKLDIVTDAKGRGVEETEGKLSKLGRTAGAVGKLAVGLGAGLGVAAAGAFKLAQGAAEDEKGQARLAQSLKNTTGATRDQIAATEDWITKQGAALGVADDQLRPALEKLAGSTGSLKVAQEQASLAMDVAAGRGMSLEAVAKALERANNGSVAGLSKLGIETKNAAGETIGMEEATRRLADLHGGQAAKAAETSAGKWGRVKLQMGELGETIGQKLLPFAAKAGEWALEMLPKAEKLGRSIGQKLGPAFALVGDFITDKVLPAGKRFAGWIMDTLVPAVEKYATPIIDGARKAFGKIADAIEDNREPLSKVAGLVKSLAETFLQDFMPIIGKVAGKGFEVIGTSVGLLIDGLGWLIDKIDLVIGKLGELRDWIARIDMPDFDLPGWAGGSVAGLTALRPELSGGPGSLDGRRGLSTAALGDGWAAIAGAAGRGALTAPAVVDARTFLTVQVDGSGIVDEHRVADALAGVLTRHAQRLGRPVVAGGWA